MSLEGQAWVRDKKMYIGLEHCNKLHIFELVSSQKKSIETKLVAVPDGGFPHQSRLNLHNIYKKAKTEFISNLQDLENYTQLVYKV